MATRTPQILQYDITAYLGDTLVCAVTWKDSTGAIIDFTGATGIGQIKVNKDDAVAVANFTVTLGGAVNNIKYALTAAEVENLGIGKWFYDIQLTLADTSKRTFIYGKLKTTQDVSRP